GDCFGGNGGWVWEPETGREQAIAGYLTSVCFSPDGRYALTGNKNDDTAQLWDLQTPQERATLAGHLTNVSAVCFSADSKLVLAMGNTTRLLDAETGQVKVAFKGFTGRGNVGAIGPGGKQPSEGNVVAISPDGKRALTGRIWGKL